MSEGYDIRARWRQVAPLVEQLDERDRAAHLDQSLGDEHLIWKRVRERLHGKS